jgi:hypothetical protein
VALKALFCGKTKWEIHKSHAVLITVSEALWINGMGNLQEHSSFLTSFDSINIKPVGQLPLLREKLLLKFEPEK